MKVSKYDYLISGSGCAGLTFLYSILCHATLKHKKILVIDKSAKNENDRTWCFWEKEANQFEHLVFHKWQNLSFESNQFSSLLNIGLYQYKMIRGLDFYNFIIEFAKRFNNVEFVNEEIVEIKNLSGRVFVKTLTKEYVTEYVFNSVVFDREKLATENSLLQHFKGVIIETVEPQFNPQEATFMDFTVSQKDGASFMYVLPTAKNTALVEYTLFTKNILKEEEYDIELKKYITNKLKISDYKIIHQEFGIIPMTDYKFSSHNGNIINIGTAAGWVKPSTGFAFKNIQKQTKKLVDLLAADKKPILKQSFNNKKFHLYDSVLLEVIAKDKMKGDEIFAAIFKKNSPQIVLKFLDNETNLWEDLQIMASVSTKIFLPIAFRLVVKGK